MMAAKPNAEMFEMLYIEADAWLDPSIPLPKAGVVKIPEGPGLGFEPDPDVMKRYAA